MNLQQFESKNFLMKLLKRLANERKLLRTQLIIILLLSFPDSVCT